MSASAQFYFDSALIAKFYLAEPGSDKVRQLAGSANRIVVSAIAVAEVSAAFHRKLRENAVARDSFAALNVQFQHDLRKGSWTLVPVSEIVLEQVLVLYDDLPDSIFLRALDALHLVTAKTEGFAHIYSNDRHLLAACDAVELNGVNPLA